MLFAAEAFRVDLIDILRAGGPRGKPRRCSPRVTLMPPIGALLPGARSSTLSILSPASTLLRTCAGESFARVAFWLAVAGASTRSAVGSPRSRTRSPYSSPGSRPLRRHEFGRQQRRHNAVLVRGPHRAVAAGEGRAGTLLAPQTQRSVEESCDEPLEANRDFVEFAAQPLRHTVNQRGTDQSLANRGGPAPLRPMPE